MIRLKPQWICGLCAGGLVLAFVGVAVLLGAARSEEPRATSAQPTTVYQPGAPSSPEQISTPATYVGVGSCTATACHGGKTDSGPNSNCAYTVWVTRDRHAKAYSVLSSSRSLAIVKALNAHPESHASADAKPWTDPRCLACHSIPSGGTTSNALLIDGVSCEACHGPASKWLAPHTISGWSNLSASKKAGFGMLNTTDIVERAKLCASCHVGDPVPRDPNDSKDPKGGVVRDVNHDLIAAGHPRLTFEFATFAAKMPVHWSLPEQIRADGQRAHGQNGTEVRNAEARNWAVGQVVAAEADARVRAAHQKNGLDFADFDCYACHHQLQDKGADRFVEESKDLPGKKPRGGLQHSVWYTTNLGLLPDPKDAQLKVLLDGFRNRPIDGNTKEPVPDMTDVARSLGVEMEGKDANGLRTLMVNVAAQGAKAMTWDVATQHYLALVALNRSRQLQDSGGPGRPDFDKKVTDALHGLYETLKFPKVWKDKDHQTHYDVKDPEDKTIKAADLDSPATFDPFIWREQMKTFTNFLKNPPK